MRPCHDCKGSGQYVGLFRVDTCSTCGGTGRSADAPTAPIAPDAAEIGRSLTSAQRSRLVIAKGLSDDHLPVWIPADNDGFDLRERGLLTQEEIQQRYIRVTLTDLGAAVVDAITDVTVSITPQRSGPGRLADELTNDERTALVNVQGMRDERGVWIVTWPIAALLNRGLLYRLEHLPGRDLVRLTDLGNAVADVIRAERNRDAEELPSGRPDASALQQLQDATRDALGRHAAYLADHDAYTSAQISKAMAQGVHLDVSPSPGRKTYAHALDHALTLHERGVEVQWLPRGYLERLAHEGYATLVRHDRDCDRISLTPRGVEVARKARARRAACQGLR